MARIAGVDIPKQKRGVISLTYIYGIGRSRAKEILATAKVDEGTKVQDWAKPCHCGPRGHQSARFVQIHARRYRFVPRSGSSPAGPLLFRVPVQDTPEQWQLANGVAPAIRSSWFLDIQCAARPVCR